MRILVKQPQARIEAKWLNFTLCPEKANKLIIGYLANLTYITQISWENRSSDIIARVSGSCQGLFWGKE
jgi:hypothetical protein